MAHRVDPSEMVREMVRNTCPMEVSPSGYRYYCFDLCCKLFHVVWMDGNIYEYSISEDSPANWWDKYGLLGSRKWEDYNS